MNSFAKIISVTAMAAALLSCSKLEKKLLTVDVIGKNTIEGFMKEYDGYVTTGEGLHAEIRTFYPYYIKYAEIAGDLLNITASADEGDQLLFNYQMEQHHVATYPRTLWTNGWSIVTQVTYILEYGARNLEQDWTDSEKETVKKIMAQAHFARALAMFDICNAFAQPYNYTEDHSHLGIPILSHVASFDEVLPRKTVKEDYEQILQDLEEAKQLFMEIAEANPSAAQVKTITDPYHISYIACEALQARIFLFMERWEDAARMAKAVMDKVELSPRSEYINMYRSSQAVPGRESILRMNHFDANSTLSRFFDPVRGASFEPADMMYTLYDADDIRRELLTYVPQAGEEGILPGTTPKAVCKYLWWKQGIADEMARVHDNFILRVSEMYLIHAEAVLQESGDTQSATDDLKALIARARGVDASAVSLPSGKEALLDAVKIERVKELCYEGHRLFDITRRKEDLLRTNNSSVKEVKYPNYRFVLPIDQYEMQSNENMIQNEGYGKQ